MNNETLRRLTRKDGSLLYSQNDFFRCEACAILGACLFLVVLCPLLAASGMLTDRILSAAFLLCMAFCHWVAGLIFTNKKVRRAADILAELLPGGLERPQKMELLRAALAYKGSFSGTKLMEAIRQQGYDAPDDPARAQLMAELARLERARFLYWLGLPLILLLPVTFFLTV